MSSQLENFNLNGNQNEKNIINILNINLFTCF